MPPKARQALVWFLLALACGGYAYLSFTAPPQPTTPGFEIGEPWRKLIQVTFILPFLLSWGFGAFAVEYLLTASWQSKDPARGKSFRLMAFGVFALVLGSWATSLVGQLRTNFAPHDSSLEVIATVAQNYAYVAFPLLAFLFIYLSSRQRVAIEREGRNWAPAALLIGILGALWLAIIFTNGSRQVAAAGGRPSYYINDALIVLTIVTPTLVAWLLGIAGALNFSSLESRGLPDERKAYSRIVNGLLIAVFNSMILNGLLSAGSERLLAAGLGFLLFIVYVFVFLAVFSYGMIARGARGLIKPGV